MMIPHRSILLAVGAVLFLVPNDIAIGEPASDQSDPARVTEAPDYSWLLDSPLRDELSAAGEVMLRVLTGELSWDDLTPGGQGPYQEGYFRAPINVLVSDPTADPGPNTTQSETSHDIRISTGTLVAGWNDSGSLVPTGNFDGYGRSTDGGATWTDLGTIAPFPGGSHFGDPSVAVHQASGVFYFATLANDNTSRSMIGVGRSVDDGLTFLPQVDASPGTAGGNFQDKEIMAIDNTGGTFDGNIYLAWTEFFGGGSRLLFSRSTTGGASFTTPIVLSAAGNRSGCFPAVGPAGELYVFWEERATGALEFVKSNNGGVSFTSPVNIVNFTPTGEPGPSAACGRAALNGNIRTQDFPRAAVDVTGGAFNGNVYVVYNAKPSAGDESDIFFMRSTNGGASWSTPIRVNDDATTNANFFPEIAVNASGQIVVSFYDRRESPTNFEIQNMCAFSSDGGLTFGPNQKVTDLPAPGFPPAVNFDPNVSQCYMGEYNWVVADGDDFIFTWGDNRNMFGGRNDPDVFAARKASCSPDISVNPPALSFTLSPGDIDNATLTISNVAAADCDVLVWALFEEDLMTPAGRWTPPRVSRSTPATMERGASPPSMGLPPVNRSTRAGSGATTGSTELPLVLNDYGFGLEGVNALMSGCVLSQPEILYTYGATPGAYYASDFGNGGDFTFQYALDFISNELYRVGIATGVSTLIGPSVPSTGSWNGMSLDPTTGIMYAVASDGSTSALYRINLATGAATPVGNITNGPVMINLAIDNSGQAFGVDILADNLVAINTATGAGTIVGPIGFDASFAQGMDFDASTNICYYAAFNNTVFRAELRTVNTATGATTLIGPLGGTFPGGLMDVTGFGVAASGEDCPWLSASPSSGSSPGGGGTSVSVTVDATGLSVGIYQCALIITSNDPDEPATTVPVTLEVIESPPDINVDPVAMEFNVPQGGIDTMPLAISNLAGSSALDLEWHVIDVEGLPRVAGDIPTSVAEDFPQGTHPPSLGPAPETNAWKARPYSSPEMRMDPTDLGYGPELWNDTIGGFILNTPELMSVNGPMGGLPHFGSEFGNDGDFSFQHCLSNTYELYRVNIITGATVLIGPCVPLTNHTWTGLALDPVTGVMYATSSDVSISTLYTVDLVTGAATIVGEITGAPAIINVAADNTGELWGVEIVTDTLFHIDRTTGAGTLIGSIGFDANFAQGADFDATTNTMYLAAYNNVTGSELRTVDLASGATVLLGAIGATSPGGFIHMMAFGVATIREDCPWLVSDPGFGITAPGFTDQVDVRVDASLPVGSYTCHLEVISNDPDENPVNVIVTLNVLPCDPPDIAVSGVTNVSVPPGGTTGGNLLIENVPGGACNLEWSIYDTDLGIPRHQTELPRPEIVADFPRGTHPPSAGKAPALDARKGVDNPAGDVTRLDPSDLGFGPEAQTGSMADFALNVPEVFNGAVPISVPEFFWGAEFGNNGDFSFMYALRDGVNELVTIAVATGNVTSIGACAPLPGETWSGLAMDRTTGRMFASSTNISVSTIYTINLATGAPTVVGTVTGAPALIAIAIDNLGQMYGHDILTDELLSIDKTTGAGTIIGSLGFDANFAQGMDFDESTNTLYLAAFNGGTFQPELRVADTSTGATALVGVLGNVNPGGLLQLGAFGVATQAPDCLWVSAAPDIGSTPGGGNDNVTVTFDAAGLPAGTYQCNLVISSNDQDENPVIWPLTMDVIACPPDIAVSPASLSMEIPVGGIGATSLLIENTAASNCQALDWNIEEQEVLMLVLDDDGSVARNAPGITARVKRPAPPGSLFARSVSSASVETPQVRLGDTDMFARSGRPSVVPATSNGGQARVPFDVSLILDDGTRDESIGLTAGGQFLWLNRFSPTPAEFPFTLTEVQVLFGSGVGVNVGELVDIYVYTDPDGDGDPATNAVFKRAARDLPVQAVDDVTWSVYPIDPVTLEGPGDVNILVVNRTAGTDPGEFPASLDQTSSQGRSWVAVYSTFPGDPPSLPPNQLWGLIDDFGLPGNWMVRGFGEFPGDCPWVATSPVGGTTAPGASQVIDVFVDATGLAVEEDYRCLLVVRSNDPDTPEVTVPLDLHIKYEPTRARVDVCYGSTGTVDGGRLLSIDPTTGAGTLIGGTGLVAVPGLAIAPTGEMYGATNEANSTFHQIDASSGASVFIGATGVFAMTGMVFDAAGQLWGVNPSGGLYTIDTGTGVATLVGPIGIGLAGLAFDPTSGRFYGSGGGANDIIYTINVVTGAATPVGPTGFQVGTPDIHFDSSGQLYGAIGGGRDVNFLIQIDKFSGNGVQIGPIGFIAVSGLALMPTGIAIDVADASPVPIVHDLRPAAPNPFNPRTRIAFAVPRDGHVKIDVFNTRGQQVAVLVDQVMTAGVHEVPFDATGFASGVYYYRMASDAFRSTHKMTLLK